MNVIEGQTWKWLPLKRFLCLFIRHRWVMGEPLVINEWVGIREGRRTTIWETKQCLRCLFCQ